MRNTSTYPDSLSSTNRCIIKEPLKIWLIENATDWISFQDIFDSFRAFDTVAKINVRTERDTLRVTLTNFWKKRFLEKKIKREMKRNNFRCMNDKAIGKVIYYRVRRNDG